MLHGAYNLQNWHEKDELRKIYRFVQTRLGLAKKFVPLPEPIVTRWWLVGACAVVFKQNIETWKAVLKGLLTFTPASTAVGKIASSTLGLMHKPTIMCDLEILCTFHSWFLFRHFRYLQKSDEGVAGTPSFLSRHLLVRYFVMTNEMEEAIVDDKWKTMGEFRDVIAALERCSDQEKEMQVRKVQYFLKIVKKMIDKHFGKWATSHLFYSLFSEQQSGRVVAHFMSGVPYNGPPDYESTEHKTKVNLVQFYEFLKAKCDTEHLVKQLSDEHMLETKGLELQFIRQGMNMWDTAHNDSPLGALRDNFVQKSSALPSNSQFTEQGVKESNYCTLGRREEKTRSIQALARGTTVSEANLSAKIELQKSRESRAGYDSTNEQAVQIQGKEKTRSVIREALRQEDELAALSIKIGPETYKRKRDEIARSLTQDACQFKKIRVDKKVDNYIQNVDRPHLPSVAERRPGYHVTPLVGRRIQIRKMPMDRNFQQVRAELRARGVSFSLQDNWSALIKKLQDHEGDKKYFSPVTKYENFVWNDLHKEREEVSKITISSLRKNENIENIRSELSARNVAFDNSTSWKDLLTLLKDDEGGNRKEFAPRIPFERFVITPRAPRSWSRPRNPTTAPPEASMEPPPHS